MDKTSCKTAAMPYVMSEISPRIIFVPRLSNIAIPIVIRKRIGSKNELQAMRRITIITANARIRTIVGIFADIVSSF